MGVVKLFPNPATFETTANSAGLNRHPLRFIATADKANLSSLALIRRF